MQNILKDKVAVVYGAGSIGGTVAQTFAREGARVFVANRSEEAAEKVAAAIRRTGGQVETAKVDALDWQSIESFVQGVVTKTGRLDISFNVVQVSKGGEQGTPLVKLKYEDFALPITVYTKTQFLTANAATPQMVKQGSGVIMMITAFPSRLPLAGTVGFGPAWAAIEALSRTLAAELGPHGIRTVCLHSTGTPESAKSIETTWSADPEIAKIFKEDLSKRVPIISLIPKLNSLQEVGEMAAFMASDLAGSTTGTIANMSSGIVV